MKRRDREKVNEAVREGLALGPLRPGFDSRRHRSLNRSGRAISWRLPQPRRKKPIPKFLINSDQHLERQV
jgi:hypothetical protein